MRLLRGYLRVVRPYWLGALTITAAALLVGLTLTVLQPEVYRAEARAVVALPDQVVLFPQDVNAGLVEARAVSYVTVATSMHVAEKVADELRLDAADLISRVHVTRPAGTAMLEVSAADDSPLGAQQLANTWVEATVGEVDRLEGRGDKWRSGVRLVPVADAELPASPVAPDPVRNLAAALGLGLLLGLAYALIRRAGPVNQVRPYAQPG